MTLDDIIRDSVSYGINNPNYGTPMQDTLSKMTIDSSLRLNPQQDINLYAGGGKMNSYTPSNSIKKRITQWEGSSMKTNRPFDVEAAAFNRYLPKEALSKLNQSQLDGLFSYSYNVGSGNFNKRTVPTLKKYLQGKATIADVQKSMSSKGIDFMSNYPIEKGHEDDILIRDDGKVIAIDATTAASNKVNVLVLEDELL